MSTRYTKAHQQAARRRQNLGHLSYVVKFQGLYFSSKDGIQSQKHYSVEVDMEQEDVDGHPLGSFAAFIGPVLLPAMYPDYTALATWEIVGHTCSNPDEEPLNFNLMTYHELADYCDENTDVVPHLYDSVGQLRTAYEEWAADPDGFRKNQDAFSVIQGKRGLEKRNRLLKLNMDRISKAKGILPLMPNDKPEKEDLPDAPPPAKGKGGKAILGDV